MADNYVANAGSGGKTFRSDQISSIDWPGVKVAYGADGSATFVSAAAPLPVGFNTVKDGSGTLLTPLVDSDGHTQIDVLALPAGNLGMRAMAASLSVVPANDITDGTYIGDIKFGEAMPAGTALIGKVGIDQTTPGTTNAVVLTTGSAAIGKLAANTGVDIGDVDVTSIVPGIAATNLGKAEDAQHTSGDVGVQVLAVRNDTLAALATTDGDYAPLQVDAAGAVFANALAAQQFSYGYDGATQATLKRANIIASSSGTNELVAAVEGKKIRVVSIAVIATSATAVNLYFNDGTASLFGGASNKVTIQSTGVDGPAGFVLPYNPAGWMETAAVNRAINLNLSGAVAVAGSVQYVEVD